jgi:large exoprotein involved in heme utilization and adhesion
LLILDNGGLISAETRSTRGGNITLQLEDALILRRGSRLSTTAGTAQAGGDGGDIAIATDFIVAVPEENSDITANAFEGRGGNINITARGIFGIEFRERLTPLSDITASSEFGIDGVVEIDEPEVDPSEGIVDLPAQPVDATQLVAQTCPADAGENPLGEFVITGRGGLPASPDDTLSTPVLWQDLRPLSPPTGNSPGRETESEASEVREIVEAQGWRIGKDGNVILTASASSPAPSRTQLMPVTCQSTTSTNPE